MKVGAGLAKRVLLWGVPVAAGAAWVCLALKWGFDVHVGASGAILILSAFVGEFLPVDIERNGVRLTFALPFVASLALLDGPAVAAAVAVAAACCSQTFGRPPARRQVGFDAARRRVAGTAPAVWLPATVAASAVAGGATATLPALAAPRDDLRAILGAVVYIGFYGLVSFLLLAATRARAAPLGVGKRMLSRLRLGLACFFTYAVLGAAVAVLARERCLWGPPMALIPVWVFRSGLADKSSGYERYYETIKTLTLMLQRAHPYTHGHLERVAEYAEQVALRLGFASGHARLIREASVLHDLGKIEIDEAVLDKPGKLTEDEMMHVRLHAEFGAAILAPVGPFEALVPWVRHHHERPDGRGYPDRMLDVEIPLESKIIAVADAFDAMTVNELNGDRRSYRDPMSVEDALLELERCSGTQFDARVVAVFRDVVLSEVRP